ncbi:MAG: GNAT family N-acetyltransferase [Chitinophagaceae bacterium]
MKEINIRTATTQDAALIADLSRSTFHETFAAQNTAANMEKFMNGQFSAALLMKEVGAPGNIFLLAFTGEEPAGYVRLRENNNPPELGAANALEIARIYATSNAIGKGVGKALMQECIRIALEMKKELIWLGVWEHNQRAIEFYARWGFTKFAEHEFLLGDDAQTDWLMKKDLIR